MIPLVVPITKRPFGNAFPSKIPPPLSEEAAVYAKALPSLHAAEIGVSLFDLRIGVHAAATGAVLVSHDAISPRIAKLTGITKMVDWASDL